MEDYLNNISSIRYEFFKSISQKKKNIYAHRLENEYETLQAHTELVLKFFKKLVENYQLEGFIKKLILNTYFTDLKITEKWLPLITEMFFASPVFHDFGKINPGFQKQKMKNPHFSECNSKDSYHSIIGKILYLDYFYKKIMNKSNDDEETSALLIFAHGFANIINSHHSSGLNDNYRTLDAKKWKDEFSNYNEIISENVQDFDFKMFIDEFPLFYSGFRNKLSEDHISQFSLFPLFKLNYSLLTAADYFATNEFMNKQKIEDFGIADKNFRNDFINGIFNIEYNRKLKENHKDYLIDDPELYKNASGDNLNILRTAMAAELIENIRENYKKRLFYIEAPTGGGKTNLSALAVAELLNKGCKGKKIYYVFPFINLITQTVDFFKNKVGIAQQNIGELHSRYVNYGENDTENLIEENDADYGSNKKNFIDFQFANYPLIFLSHIRFFEILVTPRKQPNYLYHKIANSIVIIDEVQAYDPYLWPHIAYLLAEYSEAFNITFIVMSATLPHIGDIVTAGFHKLIPYRKKLKFFENNNFAQRAKIDTQYLDYIYKDEKEKTTKLADWVLRHSKEYFEDNDRCATIVEFLTKKRASEFHKYMKENDQFFDKILLISGTILEPKRKQIIRRLKRLEQEENIKILVVATQVIEAGVDIDMDIGFKDSASPDFDEQLLGRINRNCKKSGCVLYLFRTGDDKTIYKSDKRIGVFESLCEYDKNEVINKKNFVPFYNKVLAPLRAMSQEKGRSDGLNAFQGKFRTIDYFGAEDILKIIKQKNVQIFVPIQIPLSDLCEYCDLINMLDRFSRDNDGMSGALLDEGNVRGEILYEIFIEKIRYKNSDFLEQKADVRNLMALMSNFTFSLIENENGALGKLKSFFDEEKSRYGYLYLNPTGPDGAILYDYDNGLADIKVFEDNCMII